MSKKSILGLILAAWTALPSTGNALCSCWTTIGSRDSGSKCTKSTPDSYLLHQCTNLCKEKGGEGKYGYIDQLAYDACKSSFSNNPNVK